MKILTLTIVAAFGWSLSSPLFAQEKKKADAAPAATAKKANEKPATAADKKAANKPIPMYARADSISVSRKTFTMKTKDGREIKHSLTDSTEVRNGDAAAKLADIKEGDWVSGTRIKKGDADYEVVKITKFGPRPDNAEARKAAKGAKKEAAKPEEKTTNKN